MSQNDRILKEQGFPILSNDEKQLLRSKWQEITFSDMELSLDQYDKYVMLRPTGFGKTYICAKIAGKYASTGKVIFVYKSEILKRTFEKYTRGRNRLIKKASNIIYETYASVGLNWGNKDYLDNVLDIKNVDFIIFDECQYMGAETYRKALDFALSYIGHDVYTDDDRLIEDPERLGKKIPYIGATATIERRDVDVCDKYFTYNNNGHLTYCWGEHIFTLEDAFKTGLIIPPYYKYIGAVDKDGKSLIAKSRLTRKRLLKNLQAFNKDGDKYIAKSMKELQDCMIYNADKIIHDTMFYLYDCKNVYTGEELPKAEFNSVAKPQKLPKYMRFLVFTHDRDSLSQFRADDLQEFMGVVGETRAQFENAFGRYGYHIRTTIISSASAEETNNVNLIDPTPGELLQINAQLVDVNDISKAVTDRNGGRQVIDLVFSINMLNVGYHVDKITGLVLRRWTGSNTIYYQQLGRCLSVDSDQIPVVFDFVDSIASAEITAPLFAVDKEKKAITTYADGTQDTSYKGKRHKKRQNRYIKVDGKLFNPKWTNLVKTPSVIIDDRSASCEEILGRLNIYETQVKAYSVFEEAYRKYLASYKSTQGKIEYSDKMLPLYESFRVALYEKYKDKLDKQGLVTVNAAAFYNYVKRKGFDVFIEYGIYKRYCMAKEARQAVNPVADEYNSLLMVSKSQDDLRGARLNFVVNSADLMSFEQDPEIKEQMQRFNMTKENIFIYERTLG